LRIAPVLILLILVSQATIALNTYAAQNSGLLIVTTFDNLKYDVQQLVAPGDRVVSIVPPGVDPHSYSLKPRDIELLKKADIIVSTGHVTFEKQIEKMVKDGMIKAYLIEIPGIPGLKILDNPVTGEPNLHMPIYDPYNYIVFIIKITSILIKLRPSMENIYMEHMKNIVDELLQLMSKAGELNGYGVGESPPVQYAVDWLGLKIKYLAMIQPGVPAPPSILEKIRYDAERHIIKYVVVIKNSTSSAHNLLIDIAEKYGLKIIYVPSPTSPTSMLVKIEYIVKEINNETGPATITNREVEGGPAGITNSLWLPIIIGITSAFLMAYYVLRRESKG